MAVSNTAWPRCTIWSSSGKTMNAGSVTMPPRTLEYMAWKLTALACTACCRRALASAVVKTGVDSTIGMALLLYMDDRCTGIATHCIPLYSVTQSPPINLGLFLLPHGKGCVGPIG